MSSEYDTPYHRESLAGAFAPVFAHSDGETPKRFLKHAAKWLRSRNPTSRAVCETLNSPLARSWRARTAPRRTPAPAPAFSLPVRRWPRVPPSRAPRPAAPPFDGERRADRAHLLQYKDRGAHSRRDYADLYPSLNTTWHFTANLQARAAFARTIGHPNFNEIIPNTSISDPAATETNRTITVVNTGLQPWTASNYDIALEYYFERSGRVAVSGFHKDISNFFGTIRTDATPELLAEFGLGDDYLDYDVITKQNVGDARVTGFEFDYQQPLHFLPNWARGTMAFFNLTKSHLEGASTANFSGFTRESINWGISVSRPRWNVKLVWNYRGRQRLGQTSGTGVAPGTYTYNPEYLTLNVNAEYRFSRRFALYTVIRNVTNEPLITEIYGPATPEYAHISNYQNLGSQISVGLKGEW